MLHVYISEHVCTYRMANKDSLRMQGCDVEQYRYINFTCKTDVTTINNYSPSLEYHCE